MQSGCVEQVAADVLNDVNAGRRTGQTASEGKLEIRFRFVHGRLRKHRAHRLRFVTGRVFVGN
jgi:hypothetical protein